MSEQDEAARMKAVRAFAPDGILSSKEIQDEAARLKAARAASEADLELDVRRDPVRAPWQHPCPECGTWHNRKGARW